MLLDFFPLPYTGCPVKNGTLWVDQKQRSNLHLFSFMKAFAFKFDIKLEYKTLYRDKFISVVLRHKLTWCFLATQSVPLFSGHPVAQEILLLKYLNEHFYYECSKLCNFLLFYNFDERSQPENNNFQVFCQNVIETSFCLVNLENQKQKLYLALDVIEVLVNTMHSGRWRDLCEF